MKLTIAFFSIILTLGFGACSTASSPKVVRLTSCTPGDQGKVVILETNSFAPGTHEVVRLAAHN